MRVQRTTSQSFRQAARIALLALPAVVWGQGGAPVEGVVVSATTRVGLANVRVSVTSTTGKRITYDTTSNSEGSFRIASIDQDGEFRAEFIKDGYRQGEPVLFRLSAAAGAVRLQAELRPLPVLRGRVLDSEGRPAVPARVEIISPTGNWLFSAMTTKDGSFTFQSSLPSPSFVLRAVPLKGMAPPEAKEDAPAAWAPTYYPDGTERSGAEQISWRSEGDLEGYVIRLRATPVFRVRGVVMDEAARPVSGATVKLVQADGAMPLVLAVALPEAQAKSDADGTFELTSVRPGNWLVAAEWKRGEQSLSAQAKGRVARTDWEDVRLTLEAPFTLTGVVEAPENAGSGLGTVILTPADDSTPLQTTVVTAGADGRFAIPNVRAGRYRVAALGLTNRAYLDSVQVGGREALGQAVDLVDGTLPVRLVYKTDGGSVRGAVEHCSVALVFPVDPALRDGEFNRAVRCDAGGRFEAGKLRPGDYYAIALGASQSVAMEQVLDELAFTPSLYGRFTGGLTGVRVEAGQATTVSLKLSQWPAW